MTVLTIGTTARGAERQAAMGGPADAAKGLLVPPAAARLLIGAVVLAALVVGGLATAPDATTQSAVDAGPDLVRLLRGMAVIKAVMASAACAVVVWRLDVEISTAWLAGYAVAAAAMAAGTELIWGLAHLPLGATLLHGGLFVTIIMLWRDRAVAFRLTNLIAQRQSARARSSG